MKNYIKHFQLGGNIDEDENIMQMFLNYYKDPAIAQQKYRESKGLSGQTDIKDPNNDPEIDAANKAFFNGIGKIINNVDFNPDTGKWEKLGALKNNSKGSRSQPSSSKLGVMDGPAMGAIAGAAIGVTNAIDKGLMGDKNFGAQSAAIDSAVHGVSGALMGSGNPYAMAAGAALEGANFLTKAGGQTVQGFDAGIDNTGYGNLGHKDSSSSRDFGAFIGLGGLNQGAMDRKLQRRNEEAQMALKAANVSDTIKFEQEARMNSVDDVIQANKMALAGDTDTSLLSAKKGGKLERIEVYKQTLISKAKQGAKLKNIEVSEEPNVIPEGSYHKNKHNLDLENITEKGIPVITVKDDSAETMEDIKEQEDTITQHAEVERKEPILSLELTNYIEENRKKWHESRDQEICLEVGKRLVKEFLFNTEDNAGVIESLKEKDNELL